MTSAPDPIPPADRPAPPAPEDHHRSIAGGEARAAVFGVSDGLVSNIALIFGVAAGSQSDPQSVVLAGVAGLAAGACSMAAGEYVSMRAQVELYEREVALERHEILNNSEQEERELAAMYEAQGLPTEQAAALAATIHKDADLALHVHIREEIGVSPDELGNPFGAAVASFVAFSIGALVPLVPWFFMSGSQAVWTSIVAGATAALAVGAGLGFTTGQNPVRPALRQLLLGAAAAGATWIIGSLVGVQVA